jgi:hypothetical protein
MDRRWALSFPEPRLYGYLDNANANEKFNPTLLGMETTEQVLSSRAP